MSQIKFDKPLQLSIKFTKQHKLFLVLSHCAAGLLLLLPINLHAGIKVLCIGYVIISFYHITKKTRYYYRGVLRHTDDNSWLWIQDDDTRLQLQHGFVLLPRLVLVSFKDEDNKKYNWLLFPDCADKETFRKIRILVRYSTAEIISPPV